MIKRTITETICEYDQEGKLIKKTVTETHEEEDNTSITYSPTTPNQWWYQPYVYNNGVTCGGTANTHDCAIPDCAEA